MECCSKEQVILLFGKLVALVLCTVVKLCDSLFFELVFLFEFLVLFSQDLELVFDVGLFDILAIKDSVKFFELIFELSEFDICFVAVLFSLGYLLDEACPLNFNAFYLLLQRNDVFVEHLDFSLVVGAHIDGKREEESSKYLNLLLIN